MRKQIDHLSQQNLQKHGVLRFIFGPNRQIFKERANRDIRKFGFPHRIVDLWNKRKMGRVVEAKSVLDFEKLLDEVLSDQELIYDYKAAWKMT